ncbi:MAG: ABC transporter ATP-binding protein [Butyrivibrio sp.]|nr:ABC transporter ATP-binding protein [Butyrivibrio sp.]
MTKNKDKMLGGKESSWKPLMHIYKTVRIPWFLLIMVVILSFGSQWVSVKLVEYSSKIDTGTMTAGSFLVGYVAFSVISILVEYGYDLANILGNAQMARNVRRRLWGKMLRLPLSFYEKEEPQRLVSRVTKDSTFAYGAVTSVIQIISVIYGLVIAMRPVVKIFGAKSWIVAVIIPVLFICSFIVGKIQYRIDRMINKVYSKMTNFYSERLPNITYIKTNNMEKSEYEKGLKVSNEKYKADIVYKILFALQMPIQSLANYIGLVFVLIAASAMVRSETITAVQMKEVMQYFNIVMADATLLLGVWMNIKATHGGCEKIAEINGLKAEDVSGTSEVSGQQDIVFDHVSYGYTEDKLVLKDASFTIPKGKVTAIVGENGSGKSTITRLLERFDAPASGEIRIGESRLDELDCAKWRDKLGYVFQGDQMIEGTVRENLVYGLTKDYSEDELVKAAEDAGAYDFIMEKEEKFETPLHVFDSEFSGGQLQRLAIARVFMKDPEYLIMDEATSGIDLMKEAQIVACMKEKMKGRTVVLISHNMNLIQDMDHIVVIKDGQVEAEGSPKEVAKRSDTFKALVGVGDAETASE